MITMKLEMPQVSTCNENQCAYNVKSTCHARAITIGDGINPCCDTFFSSPVHSRSTHTTAGVGACKISACNHNSDFECEADQIEIRIIASKAKCMTCTL